MSDTEPQPVPILAANPQAVPSQAASQIAIAMNLNEVSIVFGQLRQILDPATGNPGAQAAVEWLVSFALPLPAAKNLSSGLGLVIEQYEKRFGTIPSDPDQKPKTLG